jgi:hypothetical protein
MFFGITIFSFSFSFFIYRKLKFINASNKNIENFKKTIHQVQQIRDKFSMNHFHVARRSNQLMHIIASFAGLSNGDSVNDKNERRPSTAEGGSQVCDEIITKRERRSNVLRNNEGEETPREGYIQEMFESSSSSCCGSTVTQVDPKIQETHTCSVCLDELCLGNTNTTTTACGHTFHLSCLLKSLIQKNLCPMCRGELEDVRTKQMPSNVLTPVSAEQIIAEEISYFHVGSHAHSITLSRHPKRRAKEMLRVFGFTLLRTVAEFVHDENMPTGWFDDSNSESESESEEDDGDGVEGDENGEEGSDTQQENDEDREHDDEEYSDNDDIAEEPEISRSIRGDLRNEIS